jgi:hypothetical protein
VKVYLLLIYTNFCLDRVVGIFSSYEVANAIAEENPLTMGTYDICEYTLDSFDYDIEPDSLQY